MSRALKCSCLLMPSAIPGELGLDLLFPAFHLLLS